MVKHPLFLFAACLALLPGGARAQIAGAAAASSFGVQNFDVSLLAATRSFQTQSVAGSNVTIYSSTNVSCCSGEVGYQFARTSAGSLWVEYAQTNSGGETHSAIPSSGNREMAVHTLGLRLMIPLHSRFSLFAAAGGGGGVFHYPWILAGSTPYLLSRSTVHGVLAFGGGMDLRLSRRISLRGELRDFVSGRGLSGAIGPHHALVLGGVGFHF